MAEPQNAKTDSKPAAPLLAEGKPPAPAPAITLDRWQIVEHIATTHGVQLAEGVAYENVLRREFWANIAAKFKPGDKIEVRTDDNAFFAQLFVWNAGRNWADVSEIVKIERPSIAAAIAAGSVDYVVEWRGGVKKHCVLRKDGRAEVRSGFETPEDAERWLVDNRRTLRN